MTTAIIGGSGFGGLANLRQPESILVDTPWGKPSAPLLRGYLEDREVCFLARHGESHTIPPHRINYRANIHALSDQGVTHVIALLAVGGIDTALVPGSLALPDQLIDYTWGRHGTFFEGAESADPGLEGMVRHAEFTEPFCGDMRKAAEACASRLDLPLTPKGTYAVTQGPRLETRAEIQRLLRDGADMVGMTALPEAALAREAGICYLGIALIVNPAAGIAGETIAPGEIEEAMSTAAGHVDRMLEPLLTAVADLDCDVPDLISTGSGKGK